MSDGLAHRDRQHVRPLRAEELPIEEGSIVNVFQAQLQEQTDFVVVVNRRRRRSLRFSCGGFGRCTVALVHSILLRAVGIILISVAVATIVTDTRNHHFHRQFTVT